MEKQTQVFQVTIPGHPPSTNRIWRKTREGRIHKSNEYTAFERLIEKHCLIEGMHNRALKNRFYKLRIIVYAPSWTHKNGKPRKPDVTNFIKSAEDAVCKAYGWDDSYCTECVVAKKEGPATVTTIRFEFEDKI